MPRILTADEMRCLEQSAIASGTVTGVELMERAGEGVVQAVLAHWPELYLPSAPQVRKAVVLCGPGNNGGDGFVIARLLQERGWVVEVLAVGWDDVLQGGTAKPVSAPDAWANARRWRVAGGASHPYGSFGPLLCDEGTILVIDALLGIGQKRKSDHMLRPWWDAWDHRERRTPDNTILKVSVDVPTGFDSDSGEALAERPFEPDLVVTFHSMKPVHQHLIEKGCEVVVVDIGL